MCAPTDWEKQVLPFAALEGKRFAQDDIKKRVLHFAQDDIKKRVLHFVQDDIKKQVLRFAQDDIIGVC